MSVLGPAVSVVSNAIGNPTIKSSRSSHKKKKKKKVNE
jgi:hypothetical protein